MRQHLFTIGLFLLGIATVNAQNLVLNPSFENCSSFPCSWLSSAAAFNSAMANWTQPSDGSVDIFSDQVAITCYAHCFSTNVSAVGHQAPRTGNVMSAILTYGAGCGFQPDYREYLQAELSQPLAIGSTYYAECYVSLGDFVDYGSNNIGFYFSTTQVYQSTCFLLNFIPQILETSVISDTASWVKVSGYFTATDTARYMIIGNFFSNAATQTYTNGGQSTNARYFIDDVSVEEVSTTPVALFTAPNQICPGTCTDFVNASQNATSFLWTFQGANPSTSTDVNPTGICYNAPGNFDVSLIASGPGGSDTLLLSNYITVFPYPPPQGIQQSGDTLFANPGATSYQWYFTGNAIPGATDYFYVAAQSGDYNVVATDGNGCEVEAAIFDVIASVEFDALGNIFNVYPNPADEILLIEWNPGNRLDQVILYNISGQVLSGAKAEGRSGSVQLDLSDLAPAMYYVELRGVKSTERIKLIKQ